MSDETKTYAEKNAGKLRDYRIMRPNATHTRMERKPDGGLIPVTYAGNKPGCPNIIKLTKAGAQTLAHMTLMPVSEKTEEIKTSKTEPPKDIMIPEDWADLSVAELKALASLIHGEDVTKVAIAREIIGEYAEQQRANGSEDGGGSEE